MSKGYVIFTNNMASFLLASGCEMLNVRPDKKFEGKKVYVFKDDSKLKFMMDKFNRQMAAG